MLALVTIKSPLLRRFFLHKFPERDGVSVKINSNSIIGSWICCNCRMVDSPIEVTSANPANIVIEIPINRYTEHLRGHFIDIPPLAMRQLQTLLDKEFNAHFFDYIVTRRMVRIKLKLAIEMFIDELGLEELVDEETLKKRYYRKEMSARDRLGLMLKKKYFYIRNTKLPH